MSATSDTLKILYGFTDDDTTVFATLFSMAGKYLYSDLDKLTKTSTPEVCPFGGFGVISNTYQTTHSSRLHHLHRYLSGSRNHSVPTSCSMTASNESSLYPYSQRI
ncbi:hypothetical protein MIND_00564600 [Mycena indigotica]|uniref:Uncharacterized protein n=1 Tax=Mycena indigotica TaxID=2126181 RepID=A0A8H6SQJ3_9AGAR|nr:uncharacterized protein MIND_00564600 [Mycena indigotica]KAF7303368.1 hypothetical protein MIND_00564600 [Mycena indigotica]